MTTHTFEKLHLMDLPEEGDMEEAVEEAVDHPQRAFNGHWPRALTVLIALGAICGAAFVVYTVMPPTMQGMEQPTNVVNKEDVANPSSLKNEFSLDVPLIAEEAPVRQASGSWNANVANVPIKFYIIKKQDGTGHVGRDTLDARILALNALYGGGDPDGISEAEAHAMNSVAADHTTCGKKCEVAQCYEGGKYKSIVDISGCHCGEDYCGKYYHRNPLTGERANAHIGFNIRSVEYITNDVWHDQCCCAYAGGLGYEPKQKEIMDKLIDKSTVRSVATVIVCDMKKTGGQSLISGVPGCVGGPGILLSFKSGANTLAHEFGHQFGLYHTFAENCPAAGCESWNVCNDAVNAGDKIADTPVHKKQGTCPRGAGQLSVDSCPGGGVDPLDNIMSYSHCVNQRFTRGQVAQMHQTIYDYYPAFTTDTPWAAKDLPCNPEFPSSPAGTLPAGYVFASLTSGPAPSPVAPPHAPAPADPIARGCDLDGGECDTYDAKGCYCHDASFCCAGHGCGGEPGKKQCLPCDWGAAGMTSDSCLSRL